jgi:hypothetical protein
MTELTIRPEEIREAIERNVASYAPTTAREEVGRVLETGDGIARVEGLHSAMTNELLEFEGGLLGLALNGSGADELVSFDLGTGAATVIGVTGTNTSTVAGLTSTTVGGLWYMTDGSTLYSLNTATGSATSIGTHGVAGFSGLAFIPSPSSLLVLGIAGLASARRRR